MGGEIHEHEKEACGSVSLQQILPRMLSQNARTCVTVEDQLAHVALHDEGVLTITAIGRDSVVAPVRQPTASGKRRVEGCLARPHVLRVTLALEHLKAIGGGGVFLCVCVCVGGD